MPYEQFEGRDKLYGRRWRKYRAQYLENHPLCRMCRDIGRIMPASVVDHIQPHKGDLQLFWEPSNHQPLCQHCHDSHKAVIESRGYESACDSSGWPIDPNHPVNRNKKH